MTFDNQLVIGIVLIGVGLLLALVAYFIFTGKTEDDEISNEIPDTEKEADLGIDVEAAEEEKAIAPDPQQPDLDPEPPASTVEETPEVEETPQSVPVEEMEDAERLEEDQPVQPSTDSRDIEMATILRHDVTGDLRIQVGDQTYTSVDQLMDSKDLDRIERIVADLQAWFSQEDKTPAARDSNAEEHPQSMVEQINAILQNKLADSDSPRKALRLIEGPEGSVRVLIGVQSYNIDEVPDADARQLIREAVAMWEESQ